MSALERGAKVTNSKRERLEFEPQTATIIRRASISFLMVRASLVDLVKDTTLETHNLVRDSLIETLEPAGRLQVRRSFRRF